MASCGTQLHGSSAGDEAGAGAVTGKEDKMPLTKLLMLTLL